MATDSAQVYELHIPYDGEDEKEMTIGVLNYLEVESIEELDDTLVIYHDQEEFLEKVMAGLGQMAHWVKVEEIRINSRPDENWNKSWEESFEPIIIDDFCAIRASFHVEKFSTRHIITIDPEMAFGTGHHETTFTIIQLMARLDFKNKTVLDYGTGTGVLAILSELLGGKQILAIDYDEVATECAIRCVALNNCQEISCKTAQIEEVPNDRQFDIILANVNRNVLLNNAHHIRSRQDAGGQLLLSGILLQDIDRIKNHYEELSYRYLDHIEKGEWASMHLIL